MTSRHSIAYFILLMGISASIFFFIRNEDGIALNILFITLYATITIFYFLRILFYVDNKATLNEIYFFSLANIIPLGVLLTSPLFPLGQEALLTFNIEILPSMEIIELRIALASILAFPYLAVSSALLLRSFTRYQFIRITSQSERGPSAEWTALFTFFTFGILFLLAGFFASDLIGVLYGLFFLFSGLGFLLGK
ncbi:MAG: hypothetical protein ACXAC8_05135 [Candidatus Hodarchaeales archaeon]|jgi:hypothetical protein